MLTRLQKYLADAGIGSRRACEQIILEGRVRVNGETVKQLGSKVEADSDRVTVDSRPVRARRKLYVALHKPPGYICTRQDPEQRATVFELLPREWGNLYPVGRLDRASEGLLFLTNDGQFCLRLTHPRFGVRKTYRVTVLGRAGEALARKAVQGVREHGEFLKADKARVLAANNSHSLIELELTEGKNQEVRRLLGTLGLTITRLERIKIGRIKLGELPPGKWRILTEPEISSLLGQL